MRKTVVVALVLTLLMATGTAGAGAPPKSGEIGSSTGLPDRDLRYEDFQITEDGHITGYIVNASGRARKGIQIDMWTTNKAETRILWRKSLAIGDLGPREKRWVREPYAVDSEEPARTEIKFRISSSANFRNK
ncbi:MAG: hypothetical protein MUF52_10170 [Syntrophobacteraceae bacterium]|jgi:hypothetical protein|nr:hypothetical protein [Syntrophobacteraceae bacterium]